MKGIMLKPSDLSEETLGISLRVFLLVHSKTQSSCKHMQEISHISTFSISMGALGPVYTTTYSDKNGKLYLLLVVCPDELFLLL